MTSIKAETSLILNKLASLFFNDTDGEYQLEKYRSLIRREAGIGGQLFGPLGAGKRREFFCLDENTWIWHEEWLADDGTTKMLVTRYDVRPNGVFKAQDHQPYQPISSQEAKTLYMAIVTYNRRVDEKLSV